MYNTALTEEELQVAVQGEPFARARGAVPENGSLHNDTWATLAWTAGDFAVSQDVYLSDNFDDVDEGALDAFRGDQIATDLITASSDFRIRKGSFRARLTAGESTRSTSPILTVRG